MLDFVETAADLRFADYSYKFADFAICRLENLRNLLICDSGMNVRIGEFAICGIQEKFFCLPLFFRDFN